MRTLRLLLLLAFPGAAAALSWSAPVHAQVTESERAAARQLFKEGDELQRAGKFNEALDKFERAQQVFSAPTNVLRIAECEAALGHLVASTESYRAIVRTPLPHGSPPAFQAAVDQARGELSQVEPRVPKLVVQVEPPGVPGPQLQIDGQAVPAALFGEPFPLDPGPHKVLVFASGYVSAEQSVVLKERETRSLQVALKSISGITYAPGSTPPPPPVSTDTAPPTEPAPGAIPPPPPVIVDANAPGEVRKRSRLALVLGVHLGLELPAGQIPAPGGTAINTTDVSGGGFAYALDAGLRFARYGYVGLTLEHAGLGGGKTPNSIETGASGLSSNTTALGAVIGIIGNPDRVSFFGEVGLQARWYSVSWKDPSSQSASYSGGELLLGMGIWIPAGHTFRVLPQVTGGLGTFSPPNGSPSGDSNSPGHGFVMLGIGGLFDIPL